MKPSRKSNVPKRDLSCVTPRLQIPSRSNDPYSPEESSTADSRKQSKDASILAATILEDYSTPMNLNHSFQKLNVSTTDNLKLKSKKKNLPALSINSQINKNGNTTKADSFSNILQDPNQSIDNSTSSTSFLINVGHGAGSTNRPHLVGHAEGSSHIMSGSTIGSASLNRSKNLAPNKPPVARRPRRKLTAEKKQHNDELILNPENIRIIDKLGEGSVGVVYKAIHIPSGTCMARKSVAVYPDEPNHRQLVRELSFLKQCDSPSIVKFYGAYYLDNEDGQSICMCMEYCDGGSLDNIYKRVGSMNGRIGEGVLGKIAEAVINGLVYLHQYSIIHRDIKPSNILVTGKGQIKLCDFGVSGELVDSIAQTFVGTSYYMAPERIQGSGYAVQSDVWSLGLTLLEVALNRFPFPPEGTPPLTIIELLDYIVRVPIPSLDSKRFSPEIINFTDSCLIKSPKDRPTPSKLLEHPFIQKSQKTALDLESWIKNVWGN
ncbi:hypothetical protein BB559_001229 [Furculomyces boomerangus]|uniref:mitogen-activated protein kinase kinase n=2 Tax=Harpellales TaxID=61421 RepID=A0A2T9Z2S0_9FUNG|nr:hypothetical protein BB559_001229 [Furculomyces boomerangus]PWA00687.1 hypothetical protein BB558_003263 [Smittium angustum]